MRTQVWRRNVLFLLAAATAPAATVESDVCIFGATPAGIAAAVQTVRMGHTVALVEPSAHAGGLTTGGLGATDIGNKAAIGGLAREFYEGLHDYYQNPAHWRHETAKQFFAGRRGGHDPVAAARGKPAAWLFEPRAAAEVYRQMLAEVKVVPRMNERLRGVQKEGARLTELAAESGTRYRAKVFLDCTYEGDLMDRAGVPWHIGREANATYGEKLNGVRPQTPKHQFTVAVDPWVKPGDPSSGLLPFIQNSDAGEPGSGDRAVQAYNYRICMTQVKENLVAWQKPAGYDESKYELLARYIVAREAAGQPLTAGQLMHPLLLPNRKTDTNNNGAFSTDFIGMNYAYPEAGYEARARIANEHENYLRGFLWFLSSSPRVPAKLRDEMNTWGLAMDEWPESGGWPPQLYVREARRMISGYVMTEHECRGTRTVPDSAGLGAYNMDSHNCRRIVRNGRVENEGDVQEPVKPYPISYRSIIARASECENLGVPVCLAASHIAYGSIRMEPVFMILGQSAATAACLAMDGGVTLGQLPYAILRERLLADGQVLEFGNVLRGR